MRGVTDFLITATHRPRMESTCLSVNRVQTIGATCVSGIILLINSAQTEVVPAKESSSVL